MDVELLKPTEQFKLDASQAISEAEDLAKQGNLDDSLKKLRTCMKKAPEEIKGEVYDDTDPATRVLVALVAIASKANDWKLIVDQLRFIMKRYNSLKSATCKMVEHAIELENSLPEDGRFDRIRDLWNITEDRVHVEVLRARLTRKLCDIYVQNGDVEGAARTIQKIQIETFGSVPQNEKVDFILEQMRLSIEIADFTNATILSKKINLKYFEKKDKDNDKRFQQKVAFYQRMIQCYMHEKNYLEISKQYQHIYNTEEIKSDNAVWPDILRNVALYVILAPFSNEQSDLIHHIINEPRLDDLKLAPPGNHLSLLDVAKGFIQPELLDWEYVLKFYTPTLQSTPVFSQDTEEGRVRWEEFRSRVREHNTRVVAKYYTTVTLDRLAELVGFSATNVQEIEPFLSDLIIKDMIYARIDRPKGIVSFIRPQSTEDQLNAWSNNIDELLKLVESTTHLLSKEETGRELSKATV